MGFAHHLLVGFCSAMVACSTAEEPLASSPPDARDAAASETAAADTAIADTWLPVDAATTDGPIPDTAIEAEVPVDTGTKDPDAGPPPAPVDCLIDDVGPSSVGFVDLFYERLVKDCTSSACSDFIKLDTSCVFSVQVNDIPHTTTLTDEHCTRLKKWLTSDLLVGKLRDTVTCYGSKSGIYESTQLTLSDGLAWKKTYMCTLEPFVSHRACLDKVRALYFPGL